MKKLSAFVLALALAVSASVTAFAESPETNTGTQDTSIPVTGSHQAGTPAGGSISVDIVWDAMNFTYTGESKGAWDPKNHTYGADTPAHWAWSNATEAQTAPNITLTNHSDTDIKATFKFDGKVTGLNGIFANADGITLTDNAVTLKTAVNTDYDKAPSAAVSFNVNGTGIESNQTLGNIIVTVGKDSTTGGDTDVTKVSSDEELEAAVNNNKASILVTDDFAVAYPIDVPSGYNGILDLGSHTLSRDESSQSEILRVNASMTIKNGSFADAPDFLDPAGPSASLLVVGLGADVTLENCKIESEYYVPLQIRNGTVRLKDCTITSANVGAGGTLIFSGNTILSNADGITKDDTTTVTCLAGTYNFDPSAYVGEGYTATQNTDGTSWTVTEGTSGGDTDESGATLVSNAEQLLNAAPGTYKLTSDIDFGDSRWEITSGDYVLDLNGHTITKSTRLQFIHAENSSLTIKNGIFRNTTTEDAWTVIEGQKADILLENCQIYSSFTAVDNSNGSLRITNCTLDTTKSDVYALMVGGTGTCILSGTVKITGAGPSAQNSGTITTLAGTYNFDPSDYVGEGYTVTDNQDGTWTVTAGATGGDTTGA